MKPFYRYSTQELIFRLLQKLSYQTRSEEHHSMLKYGSDVNSRPILITGMPRSGTTTLMKSVSDALNYNSLFEPLVFNHLKLDEHLFRPVSVCFRGNPEVNELVLQRFFGGSLNCIKHNEIPACRDLAVELMAVFFRDIFDRCGSNLVIKELRWLFNLDLVHSIISEISCAPFHFLIKPDPLMVLHTHYRLGGLSSVTDFNVVQVECLYQRRLAAELCVNVASRFGQYKPKNLWEKLLLACAIERDQMDSFYAAHPSDSICARFVDLLEGFPSILRHSGFNVESGEVIRLREGGRCFVDGPFRHKFYKFVDEEIIRECFGTVDPFGGSKPVFSFKACMAALLDNTSRI